MRTSGDYTSEDELVFQAWNLVTVVGKQAAKSVHMVAFLYSTAHDGGGLCGDDEPRFMVPAVKLIAQENFGGVQFGSLTPLQLEANKVVRRVIKAMRYDVVLCVIFYDVATGEVGVGITGNAVEIRKKLLKALGAPKFVDAEAIGSHPLVKLT